MKKSCSVFLELCFQITAGWVILFCCLPYASSSSYSQAVSDQGIDLVSTNVYVSWGVALVLSRFPGSILYTDPGVLVWPKTGGKMQRRMSMGKKGRKMLTCPVAICTLKQPLNEDSWTPSGLTLTHIR